MWALRAKIPDTIVIIMPIGANGGTWQLQRLMPLPQEAPGPRRKRRSGRHLGGRGRAPAGRSRSSLEDLVGAAQFFDLALEVVHRWRSSVVNPGRRPLSRSAWRSHWRRVSRFRSDFSAIEPIAVHCQGIFVLVFENEPYGASTCLWRIPPVLAWLHPPTSGASTTRAVHELFRRGSYL